MDSASLKRQFLEFFKSKGHAVIPGASLVPEHDPTVLFTTAGMHPLVPYLLGEKHPAGKRLADVQKCIRTNDIDEVGDDVHLTFFEMLGNWSLGDYWKEEAIGWSFEFLTKNLGIPVAKLAITCFKGDNEVPKDDESAHIWEDLGIPPERIYFLGRDDNWWGPAGQTGPCGPDTEVFYWTGKGGPQDMMTGKDKGKWVEIWNDVFMQYLKLASGDYASLDHKNVDTGMGVERTVAVLNGLNNIFETDVFVSIIGKIEEISDKKYEGENMKAFRIIADHIKAAVFMLSEKIEPSNVERGYVLRRLIRRAVRYGRQLGIGEVFIFRVAQPVLEIYKEWYPELHKMKDFIEEQLVREEDKFNETLERGIARISKYADELRKQPEDLDKFVFDMYQSYGFPVELTFEELKQNGIHFVYEDLKQAFQRMFEQHQELSRAGSEQKFKGGLADHAEKTVKYHTAAHLMLEALRQVLGPEVFQKGSNITAERLRFDFSHGEKMTPEEINEVEDIVNKKIVEDLPVEMEEMTLDEAKKRGAMGVFESKYGERVKVYSIGDFSKEICGGPHVLHTGELGKFRIVKEESSSAGVRRIKAVLE